jgi:hypothetical protein
MQLSLFDRRVQIELTRTQHGGDVRRGQRKLERPVSTRRPMHLVLTSHRARGPLSLRKHDAAVRDVLRRMARRFEVRGRVAPRRHQRGAPTDPDVQISRIRLFRSRLR